MFDSENTDDAESPAGTPTEPTTADKLKTPRKSRAKAAKGTAGTEGDETDDAETPAGKRFRVRVPGDKTLPDTVVEAETAGDAELVYKERTGIITCGHPISVSAA